MSTLHQADPTHAGSAASAPPAPLATTAAVPPAGGGSGRRPRRRMRVVALAAVVAAVATGAGFAYERATAPEPPAPLGPGDVTIELDIEHSLFTARTITVYEGTRLRFVLDNGDPIGHELIVGGPDIHATHAAGTHPKHASIPGEVSVSPNGQAVTTFRFDDPGPVEFACHLPGHYEYGMHGTIEVLPRDRGRSRPVQGSQLTASPPAVASAASSLQTRPASAAQLPAASSSTGWGV